MSIQAMTWAINARVGDPTLKCLLIAIGNYANENGECWATQGRLAHDTEISTRSVRRCIGKLVEAGLAETEQLRRQDGGKSSVLIRLKMDTPPPDKMSGAPPDTRSPEPPDAAVSGATGHKVSGPSEPSIYPSGDPKNLPGVIDDWPDDFLERFWERYPPFRRGQKGLVADKLAALRRGRKLAWAVLWAGVCRYAESEPGEYAQAPLPWLRGQKWDTPYRKRGRGNGPSMFDIAAGRDRAAQQQEERDHDRRQELVERGPDDRETPI